MKSRTMCSGMFKARNKSAICSMASSRGLSSSSFIFSTCQSQYLSESLLLLLLPYTSDAKEVTRSYVEQTREAKKNPTKSANLHHIAFNLSVLVLVRSKPKLLKPSPVHVNVRLHCLRLMQPSRPATCSVCSVCSSSRYTSCLHHRWRQHPIFQAPLPPPPPPRA